MNVLTPQKITSPDIFATSKATLLPPRNPKASYNSRGKLKPFRGLLYVVARKVAVRRFRTAMSYSFSCADAFAYFTKLLNYQITQLTNVFTSPGFAAGRLPPWRPRPGLSSRPPGLR